MHQSDPDETIVAETSSAIPTPSTYKKKKKKRKKGASLTATEKFLLRGTLLESAADVEKSEESEKQRSAVSGAGPYHTSRGESVKRTKRVQSPTRQPNVWSLPPDQGWPLSESSRDQQRKTTNESSASRRLPSELDRSGPPRSKKKRRKKKTVNSDHQKDNGENVSSAVSLPGSMFADGTTLERYIVENNSDSSRKGFATDSESFTVDGTQERGHDALAAAELSTADKATKPGRTKLLCSNKVSPSVDSTDAASTSWIRHSLSMSESVEEERHGERLTRPDSGISYAQDDVFEVRGNERDAMSASSRHDHSIKLDVTTLPPLLVLLRCHPFSTFSLSLALIV